MKEMETMGTTGDSTVRNREKKKRTEAEKKKRMKTKENNETEILGV